MNQPKHSWPDISDATRALMRKGAELAQSLPVAWLERMDASLFSESDGQQLIDDPVLLAAFRRVVRAGMLHWANSNLRNPCEPVERFVSADLVEIARELTRRSMQERLMNAVRAAQNVCWGIWMRATFQLTQDARQLEELLGASERSINHFFEGIVREVTQVVQDEKALIEQSNQVDKRYLVSRLLEGRESDIAKARRQLNYNIGQMHQAGLLWSVAPDTPLQSLEEMARALAQQNGTRQPLIVLVGPATLWIWLDAAIPLEPFGLQNLAQAFPDVRVALGSPGKGLNGFRRSHLEALTTQRMMSSLAGAASIVSIDQVRMVSLMTQDARDARRFVIATLGRLANESTLLQRSLHVFLSQGCNITRTAEMLNTHRNTLLRRLERAESFLPVKLADHRIQVGAALELLLWSKPLEDDER